MIPTLMTSTKLTILNLARNHLNGTIPSSIGDLTMLSFLDLSYNNFEGTIPSSLASLYNLQFFKLTDNHNICDACFRFNILLATCDISGVSQNCSCDHTPCGNSTCSVDPTCLHSKGLCAGIDLKLGVCSGDTLIIDGTLLNEKNEVSLSNIKSIINGDASLSIFNISSSNITVNGSVYGHSSLLYLHSTTFTVKEDFSFYNSTIFFDTLSSITIYGTVNLTYTTIILDLNFTIPPSNKTTLIRTFSSDTIWPEILLINSPPLPCESSFQQTKSSLSLQLEVIFKVCVGGAGGSVDTRIIIGASVGGVLLIAVSIGLIGALIRKKRISSEIEKLRQKKISK
eukprot:TRINITY_DN4985_c0_g1_i1.p1 TRINITY_DN4985_c0_g1~~TRINITY_DN4985_c0_g1_i1.p1  ORF type:complete len:341 (-),score=66.45 TRINITY_DN4985_c0_g1_i1:42-1064(-)